LRRQELRGILPKHEPSSKGRSPSIINYARLSRKRRQFLALTGYTPEEFQGSERDIIIISPLLLILSGIFLYQIFSLSFMGDKLNDLSAGVDEQTLQMNISSNISTNSRTLGRFNGLLWDLNHFISSPIFGVGNTRNKQIVKVYGLQVSHNGIGEILANYGLVGFVFILLSLLKTKKYLFNKYKLKFLSAFILVWFVQNSGFFLTFSPLYLMFTFLFILDKNSLITQEKLKENLNIKLSQNQILLNSQNSLT